MADIVYNRRYSTNQTYDTAFIDHLEGLGFAVDSIPEGDVTTYNYDGVLLFIVGPPSDNWVDSYPNGSFVNDLEMPILSLCRGASRNTFGMGTSSGARTVSAFTVVDADHEITDGLSGSTTIGSSVSTHGVWNLSASTNLVMHNGTAGYAGLAEITKTINSVDYIRMHFGYHRGDSLNSDGWDIFDRTLQYLDIGGYKPSGTYTSPPIDATTLPANVRIRWTADTPTDTSLTVEYSLTATDSEPGTWIEVTESEVIEINNNFLWLKYTLETTDDQVTPTLEEVYLQDATYYYYGDTETFTTEEASVGEDITVNAVTASIIFEGAAISVQAAQEVLVDVVLGSMDFDPLVPNIVTTKDNHVTDIPPPITEFESLEPSISTTIGAPVLTASQIDDYIYVEWEVG